MAYPYTIHSERRLARVTLPDSVVGSEIASTMLALYADPEWQPGFDVVWDGREIAELFLEPGDQLGFVRLIEDNLQRAGRGVDVIVVTRALDVAMANVYRGFARRGPRAAHVCSTEGEAAALLERDVR
jgi:hypothetical protein